MDYIRDYLSTVLHLPVLLPCFAVFPVRFCVSRLAIAHTDAIRAKFYWRKRITFFSKNTFNPICSTQAKKTFSCSLDSKFPLVSQGGACSRTNWPIQPELIPVPLGWKDKENSIARLPPSFPPPPQDIIPLPWQFSGTHLHSWVKRGTMKGLFFAREHSSQWPGWVMNPNLSTWGPTHHRAECLDVIGYSWALKR